MGYPLVLNYWCFSIGELADEMTLARGISPRSVSSIRASGFPCHGFDHPHSQLVATPVFGDSHCLFRSIERFFPAFICGDGHAAGLAGQMPLASLEYPDYRYEYTNQDRLKGARNAT
jgi:hypothetical protein